MSVKKKHICVLTDGSTLLECDVVKITITTTTTKIISNLLCFFFFYSLTI